ncbi:hypothetical protein AI2651V1_1259 [Klebsiella pneumoniae]|nr:hypothetical protein AI2651V1_1259 [Klebsiella pneumoniae]CAH3400978.1 hypothetical protein AI2651V1_1259 [Klebsiella pneumoniae]SBW66424.1 Uncharacterised protein [Klebsiella pneumoniae]SBY50619.1 Uncharacterised protein [Klebsiella pneumoniae]
MTSCCKPCDTQPRTALSIIPVSPGSSGHFFKVKIMKTVELLAKYLHQWPNDTTGIFMHPATSQLFGYRENHESPDELIISSLVGHSLTDDAGNVISEHEWLEEKSSKAISTVHQSDEQLRKENLYHTKLQCLAEVLGKQSFIDKNSANNAAEAINAAFDKITF